MAYETSEVSSVPSSHKSEKDQIAAQVCAEYLAGLQFKQPRVDQWHLNEDQYFGKVKKALKGRFNVPLPIMSGFVDTLLSKVDEPPAIKFMEAREARHRAVKKVQAKYEQDSTSEDNDWETKDIDGKKLAIFSGRAIYSAAGESDPKFKFNLRNVDHYDFYTDPMGGGDLENHKFCGEDNLFKNRWQLLEGAKSGLYDREAVFQVLNGTAAETLADNDNLYLNKSNRFMALGMDNRTYNYAGQGLYKFIEAGTTWKGKRYYVLLNYETKIAIRCVPLEEMFKSKLWWFTSWATHRDAYNFWSKAPADDVRPIAEVIRVLANQELDNRQKRNAGQRAYDPEVFPNPAQLEYRPDGLVAVKSGTAKIHEIKRGIYSFETPELTGTINLVNWLDGMLGQKTGVTPDSQGKSEEDKVGIYYGNMQQVADRLGLLNKFYKKNWVAIGRRYLWALSEHLIEPEAVKLIGENGVEWENVVKADVDPNTGIKIEGKDAEAQADAMKAEKQAAALDRIIGDPELKAQVSKKWLIEQVLLNGDYNDETVRVAMDVQNEGNREVLAKAAEAIEEIIQGKTPKLVRNATTAFMQKIVDFAMDNTDGNLILFRRLMRYANAHRRIVVENMTRKAMQIIISQRTAAPDETGGGMGVGVNDPAHPLAAGNPRPAPSPIGATVPTPQPVTAGQQGDTYGA